MRLSLRNPLLIATIFLLFNLSSAQHENKIKIDPVKLVSKFVVGIINSITYDDIEDEFDFMNRAKSFNYTAEEHFVTTSDGYILTLHRLSGSPKSPPAPGKKVVFMQHGFAMWSTSFILLGPERDLALMLVDAGYDVWLGNARGSIYSRSHMSITAQNKTFWEHSFHEMAMIDIPTFLEFVLKSTRQKQLTYIGFSMGTTSGYIMFSKMPKYCDKVNLFVNLAPVAWFKENDNSFMVAVTLLNKLAETVDEISPLSEIPLIFRKIVNYVTGYLCDEKNGSFALWLCGGLYKTLVWTADLDYYEPRTRHLFLSTFPAGTSFRVGYHYQQFIDTGRFDAYDYGKKKNLEVYHNSTPPDYQVEKVNVPAALFHAKNDAFSNTKDVEHLMSKLPNVVYRKLVPRDTFGHFDFLYASDARKHVYEPVIELIAKYAK